MTRPTSSGGRAAFAQRRKTLANSLTSSLSGLYTKEDIQEAIRICGLAPDVRGERLGIPEFAALSGPAGPAPMSPCVLFLKHSVRQ